MYVTINEKKCIGCNACIRVCPVHDANKATLSPDGGHSIITIDTSKCIGCGECVKSCDHGARSYIDDTEKFFTDLKNGNKITVMVAPAFRLTEPDSDAMLSHLRTLGVDVIYDVSFGADICTYMHIKAVKEKKVGKIMSQPCAALTEYMLKHKHDLIPSLSPVHSPISCTAVYLRKYKNTSGPIACISPCIAKKFEFEETGLIQYNITFKCFAEYMRKNFSFDRSKKFTFDNISAYCGKIYPKPGGLRECLLNAVPGLDVRNCEGVNHIYHELDIYAAASENDRPAVYDILSCEYGCISGPGTNFDNNKLFSYLNTASNVSSNAFKERKKQTLGKIDKQFKWFEKNLRFEDFVRTYTPKNTNNIAVSSQDIKQAYKELLKETHEEQHFDCHACGYNSCERMAMAIAKGINIPQNCHQFVVKKVAMANNEMIAAQYSVQQQNEKIVGAVAGISNDIEIICADTVTIGDNCENNSTEMASVRKMIHRLDEKCNEINEAIKGIVQVNERYREMSIEIQNITEQTHILSINASVEAARSGEAGKSFAVVAQEIRDLASNTRKTTDIVDENDEFVRLETDKVLKKAAEIEDVVKALDDVIKRVHSNVDKTSQMSANITSTAEDIRIAAAKLQS